VSDIIELNGLVGGGSVLRVGIPLAIALKKSLHITKVRYQRQKRGIQSQHQSGLNLLAALTDSKIVGTHIGSTEIFLEPGVEKPDGSYLPEIEIPSTGAVSLVFQTLSNYAFATRLPTGFAFKGGGSHVAFSPNFDVLMHVNSPLFKLFGMETFVQLSKPGFFPTGGAIGKLFMRPTEISKVSLTAGEIEDHMIISSASESLKREKVAEEQVQGYKSVLTPDSTQIGYAESDSKGATLSVVLKYDTGTIRSVARNWESRIKPMEMGKRTANTALKEINNPSAVDEQLADQLLVPLAFAPKGSNYTFEKMYPHVRTNIHVIQELMGEIFYLEERKDHFYIEKI
jgi:RNA 3'-terminal phosphate cyclase (ATP)